MYNKIVYKFTLFLLTLFTTQKGFSQSITYKDLYGEWKDWNSFNTWIFKQDSTVSRETTTHHLSDNSKFSIYKDTLKMKILKDGAIVFFHMVKINSLEIDFQLTHSENYNKFLHIWNTKDFPNMEYQRFHKTRP
jgi:hypothetical protein